MNKKDIFIRALAEFLVKDQAKKSVELAMGNEHAKQWADLRSASPLFDYPTVEEAEKSLKEFFSNKTGKGK
jgi:hypothetical protein